MGPKTREKRSLPPAVQELYANLQPTLQRVSSLIRKQLHSRFPSVEALNEHLERFAGKRIRCVLLLLSARARGGIRDVHVSLAAAIEMIHNATLVHDDVLDESLLRRGYPTLHRIWDNESAIMYGDYVFGRAFELVAEVGDPEAFRTITTAATLTCTGELLQLSRRFDVSLEETEYFEIIERKTASLFEAACHLGALGGQGPLAVDSLRAFGRHLGIAFQIVDDCLDVVGEENVVGKSLGTDITHGKITLPILLAVRESPQARREIESCLKERVTEATRGRIAQVVSETGALEQCRRIAESFVAKAKSVLAQERNADTSALYDVADFVLDRNA